MARENTGLVTGLVLGIGTLIVTVIIILIIIPNLMFGLEDEFIGERIWNETTTSTVNETGIIFNNATLKSVTCTILYVTNSTGTPYDIDVGNYTQTGVGGCNLNYTGDHVEGDINNTLWNITYTTSYYSNSSEQTAANDMTGNFTTGIGNVSGKIPQILLIAAVVLLLGVVALLVLRSRSMGIGGLGGSETAMSGGSSLDGESSGIL